MCEPRVSWGVLDDVAALVLSREGRRVLAVAAAVAAIWLALHVSVTIPLLSLLGIIAWAVASSVIAILLWRRGQDLSASYTAAREQLAAKEQPAPEQPRPLRIVREGA